MLLQGSALALPDACTALPPERSEIEIIVQISGEPEVEPVSADVIRSQAVEAGRSETDVVATRGLTSSDIRASARYEIVKLRPPDGGEGTALR
jgi:hypothetical protein